MQDASQIVKLLGEISRGQVPKERLLSTIGTERFLQLLKAQVLSIEPRDGPLEQPGATDFVSFGSPALRSYYLDRLAQPQEKAAVANSEASGFVSKSRRTGWWFKGASVTP